MPPKLCLKNGDNECDGVLSYYKEAGNDFDLYYCNRCYALVRWDGGRAIKVEGEAYPNRTK